MNRPRRLRSHPIIRDMVAETTVRKDQLILPLFVRKSGRAKLAIPSLEGQSSYSVNGLEKAVEGWMKKGLKTVLLFGISDEKDAHGTAAYDMKGPIPTAVSRLKASFGKDLIVATDVCLCGYTDHGHCGLVGHDKVLNDDTLPILAEMALLHAESGADIVSPSDMMDGRVAYIRETLDEEGQEDTILLSYAVKYASNYYGPFRDAAQSSPGKGDRKGYQMDFRNRDEALKEAELDEWEGADMLMVKPALAYLDIIRQVKDITNLPLACYNVSGEYAMVKAMAAAGLANEKELVMENLTAFKRAGADIIISYHLKDILEQDWL